MTDISMENMRPLPDSFTTIDEQGRESFTPILGQEPLKQETIDVPYNPLVEMENFADYEPLLFFGKTTLHTNYPVLKVCESYRLTLLSHFFDDSPQYGVGGFMRMLRRR